jgi:hypothetical protein
VIPGGSADALAGAGAGVEDIMVMVFYIFIDIERKGGFQTVCYFPEISQDRWMGPMGVKESCARDRLVG